MENFVGETLSCAVLDSGCTRTVCGKVWLNCYLDTLTDDEKKCIKEESSKTSFKFGDGIAVMSQKRVTIPTVIGNKSVLLETDVIDQNIPLLLSKPSMKKANTILNFNNDTVTMFGHNQKLLFTASDHYRIPVGSHKIAIEKFSSEEVFQKPCITLVIKDLSQKSAKEKQEIVRKLHRQFSHCSSDKLKHVIISSGIYDPDIL